MTTERKIEILLIVRFLFETNNALQGICSVFHEVCTISERLHLDKYKCLIHFLGETFEKHRPIGKNDTQLFFPATIENVPKRLEIIDKMITELKTQLL